MHKALSTTLAAVMAMGAVLATAAPAEAQRYRHYDRHHRGGGDATAAAIIGGVAGLALGAAIAGNNDGRRDRAYYGNRGYASSGYDYDPRYDSYSGGYYRQSEPRYRTCITQDRVYDPYIGRRVTIERRYAC